MNPFESVINWMNDMLVFIVSLCIDIVVELGSVRILGFNIGRGDSGSREPGCSKFLRIAFC